MFAHSPVPLQFPEWAKTKALAKSIEAQFGSDDQNVADSIFGCNVELKCDVEKMFGRSCRTEAEADEAQVWLAEQIWKKRRTMK